MPQFLIIILVVIGSYLLGNLNFATLITKLKRKDIRSLGSGNPGTMNMLRNFGIPLGVLTLFLDILKGAVPCILGWFLIGGIGFAPDPPVQPLTMSAINEMPPSFGIEYGIFLVGQWGANRLGLYVAGLSVIVGHVFPVFYKFKGGKGIASAIGVCAVAQPILAPIMLVAGITFIVFTKMGSLGSFIIISLPLGVEGFFVSQSLKSIYVLNTAPVVASLILIFLLFSLTVFTHRKNIVKLFSGTESRTVLLGKNKSVKSAGKDGKNA
ncbi:MAG: glycerol-3-phosphate acyltransferase [Firmicutes bacterium]|nr:glycerol-3-phosphate acyltransferase [Bacillota bacterium]